MKLREPENAERATDAAILHAKLLNEIEMTQDKIDEDLPGKAQDEEEQKPHDGSWKSCNIRNDALKKHHGNAFAILFVNSPPVGSAAGSNDEDGR